MEKLPVQITVNGERLELLLAPHRTLLDVLRNDLGLIGAKEGCSQGVCGSCTVLLNGEAVRSCLTLAVEAQGCEVTTIEGLVKDRSLDPLQDAFAQLGGVQCGFCTPGMIIAAKSLLNKNPRPSESEIRDALSGNMCRCTGYAKIIESVKGAVDASDKAVKTL
jgi:aerobic carbon-monoxide dehydrogenase small subunit